MISVKQVNFEKSTHTIKSFCGGLRKKNIPSRLKKNEIEFEPNDRLIIFQ